MIDKPYVKLSQIVRAQRSGRKYLNVLVNSNHSISAIIEATRSFLLFRLFRIVAMLLVECIAAFPEAYLSQVADFSVPRRTSIL
jgi:hypothetical protein